MLFNPVRDQNMLVVFSLTVCPEGVERSMSSERAPSSLNRIELPLIYADL